MANKSPHRFIEIVINIGMAILLTAVLAAAHIFSEAQQ
jgi:hypothetical protein